MQPTAPSLAARLDIGINKYLRMILAGALYCVVWLMGLVLFASQPYLMFEYKEGLADLSWLEWGFMLACLLLISRHVRYSRHFASGFWSSLNRLLMFQGWLACFFLSMTGLAVTVEAIHYQTAAPPSLNDDPLQELICYGAILFMLYLAAPTECRDIATLTAQPPENDKEVIA
jgi:hypothetical protein